MKLRTTIAFILIFSFSLFGQESNKNEESSSQKKPSIRFQGDSRRTIINQESVGITGIRLGVLFKEKTEVGLGIYSSNLFGILGSSVEKDYQNNSVSPPLILSSEIDFHYMSVYGEYRIIDNTRLMLTANSQIGAGWVNINFIDPTIAKEKIRERKSLVEHSIKADVKTFEWLRLIGGVGYRYLLEAEPQIKKTFNAPIYIIGFSIDFKYLLKKSKRK